MAEPALMRFTDNHEFLRRVLFDSHVKRDVLHWRAFKDKDVRMSWTFRDESLQSDTAIDEYRAYFSQLIDESLKLVGASLPAILRFTFYGLTRCIDPPLEPRHDPDPDDSKYGHLHCSTEAPHDKAHMELLAKLVNDGQFAGIARRYEKRSVEQW